MAGALPSALWFPRENWVSRAKQLAGVIQAPEKLVVLLDGWGPLLASCPLPFLWREAGPRCQAVSQASIWVGHCIDTPLSTSVLSAVANGSSSVFLSLPLIPDQLS